MKNAFQLQAFILFLSIFSWQNYSAQGFTITGLSATAIVNPQPCDSIYSMQFSPIMPAPNQGANVSYLISGTNFMNSPLVVTVSWGDGSFSTHQGFSSGIGQAITFNPPVEHAYALPSITTNYSLFTTVLNTANNSLASDSTQFTVTPCGNQTANLVGVINVDCDSNGVIDTSYVNFPFVLQSAQNPNLVYSGNMIGGSTSLSVPNGLYNVTADANWMATNGYLPMSSLFPSTVTISSGVLSSFLIDLICDSNQNTAFACGHLYLFCDADNNGQWGSNEIGINNAPVSILNQNSGQNYTTTVNNGFLYFQGIAGQATDSLVITIDQAWLGMNGYNLNPNQQTILFPDCSIWSDTIKFAVNCDSVVLNDECVKGYVFCDANANGLFDAGETPIANAPLTLLGSGVWMTIYTDQNGFYIYNGINTFGSNVGVSLNWWWMQQNGYTSTYDSLALSTSCDSNLFANFAINCGTPCADAWTQVTPWYGYFQNTVNYVKLKWGNTGTNPLQSYNLTMTYPQGVTPVLSSIANSNYTITNNTISWTITGSTSSFFNSLDIIQFNVPGGLASGTPHAYFSSITPTGSIVDCDTTNNYGYLTMILGNSYDPNDKTVHQSATLDPAIDDKLTYTIRFQNTGTAPAQDVYILDTLSANLDWSTLKMMNASHYMQLIDLGNGLMKFNFPGIWLPDSTTNEPLSHGEFTYTIEEKAGNTNGTQILNTAHIYFDWNPAIVTNTTFNVNAYLGLDDVQANDVTIYPNPTTGNISIFSDKKIDRLTVLDITGKQLIDREVTDFSSTLDLSALASGTYLVRIQSGTEIKTERIIKR